MHFPAPMAITKILHYITMVPMNGRFSPGLQQRDCQKKILSLPFPPPPVLKSTA